MNSHIAADTQIMRGINTAAVLTTLRTEDTLSVTELSQNTGLSRQAVSRALASLESIGLAEFTAPDPQTTRSGRPAQLVRFRATAGHVLGISISSRELRTTIADLRGSTVAHRVTPLADAPVIDALRTSITDLLSSASLRSEDIWSAAVGTPGIVDPQTGLVKLVPSMESLHGDVLLMTLRDLLDCPVYVDNDVKLATEGEQWRAPRPLSSLVLIEWGERLGAGIVINGILHRGASNDAGDIGFLDVAAAEPSTTVRSGLGAFENRVGSAEIVALTVANARQQNDQTLAHALEQAEDAESLERVIEAVRAGHPAALAAVAEGARRLSVGIAAVRALLDPELIVIGGSMARCGDALLTALSDALAAQVLNQPQLALSTLGDDAVVAGAIHHCLAEVETSRFTAGVLAETLPVPQ
ncbi:ROK family protein [Microbacterium tumbae]